MSAISIQQMADRVATLLEERLGARGTGLEAKLRRASRHLPRRVRAAGAELAQAAAMAQNPKLLLQIDHDAIARSYDTCVKHLSAISARARRIDSLMSVVTSIAFSVLVVALILLAVLRWRGFI